MVVERMAQVTGATVYLSNGFMDNMAAVVVIVVDVVLCVCGCLWCLMGGGVVAGSKRKSAQVEKKPDRKSFMAHLFTFCLNGWLVKCRGNCCLVIHGCCWESVNRYWHNGGSEYVQVVTMARQIA